MHYHVRGLRLVRTLSPVIALGGGATLLYIFVQREFWSIVGPLAGFTVGALIMVVWWATRSLHRTETKTETDQPIEFSQLPVQVPIIVTCLYIVLMLTIFRFYLHERPIAQYFLFGGFAGFIGYQIASGASKKRVVPQILVLSFLTYWSVQLLFPAGMYDTDTYYRYIPQIESILASGYWRGGETYMGHLLHTAEFAAITGLPVQDAYFLLATLLLTGTILVISVLDRVLPSISKETVLFAALVFAITSWTLGRGMHPNKLNYFYPLIVLFGIVGIQLYQAVRSSRMDIHRWFIIGIFIIPAVVYGHRFSAGAALLFLLAIFAFAAVGRLLLAEEYSILSKGHLGLFVMTYFLAVIGNPIHQEPLTGRLTNIITSVIVPADEGGGGSGGPGRFDQLQLDVLITSTTAQTLVFALAVIGSIWMFRQRKWDHDLVLFWIVCLGGFLGISVLFNSVDTAPQRFYGMLMLFGFNIAIGVAFNVLRKQESDGIWRSSIKWGRVFVAVLIVLLAVTSLASPIAERATSPVSDEIPDIRQHDTAPLNEGNQWADEYTTNEVRIVAPNSDVSIERTGPTQGVINSTAIESRTVVYSEWSERRGVGVGRAETLGGTTYLFVSSPEQRSDNRIYINGETRVIVTS